MRQAVILAAGFGSRLARHEGDIKPLREVGGATLIERNIRLLAGSGVEEVIVVVGYHGHLLEEALTQQLGDVEARVWFVDNDEYTKSNGISVLAAAPRLTGDFLLLMADHIFDRSIVECAVTLTPPTDGAILCVDFKIPQVFDLDDATKVVTDGQRVLAIDKQLDDYNAVDTGMFACTKGLVDALAAARSASANDDCSLSEGVKVLVERGTMWVHDIGDALWQDVDTEEALEHAEKLLTNDLLEASVAAEVKARMGAV